MRSSLFHLFLVVAICVSAAVAQQAEKQPAAPSAKKVTRPSPASPSPAMPLPSPEMRKLVNALLGTWSINEKIEPSEDMPNGGVAQGREIFRPGPGGLSLIEEFHARESTGEISGLSVTWWDEQAHGYRAIWCVNTNPGGCIVMQKLANWEGSQFVLGDEFERNGKKFVFREVLSDITPVSFTQTLQQGESGGELKRILTIHATKLTRAAPKP